MSNQNPTIKAVPSFLTLSLYLATAHRVKRTYVFSKAVSEEIKIDINRYREITDLAYISDFNLRLTDFAPLYLVVKNIFKQYFLIVALHKA